MTTPELTHKAAVPGMAAHVDYPAGIGSSGDRKGVDAGDHFLDYYLSFSGASASEGMRLDIADASTYTSGYARGLYINYVSSGTHASGGQAQGLAVDMAVTGNLTVAACITLYQAAIANKTVDGVYGVDCYMADPGTACNRFYALNLGLAHDNGAAESGFIRMRNHGAVPFDAAFRLEANNSCTHLVRLGAGTPYHSSNVSVEDGRIAIDYNGTTKYLKVYAS